MEVASGEVTGVASGKVVGVASIGVVVVVGVCCDSEEAGFLLTFKAITTITITQATTNKIHHKLFLLIAPPPFMAQDPRTILE